MNARLIAEWLMLSVALGCAVVLVALAVQTLIAILRNRLSLLDLITHNNRLNEERIFTVAGKITCLFIMVKDASDGQPSIELQGLMAGIVFAHELLKRWQGLIAERDRASATEGKNK